MRSNGLDPTMLEALIKEIMENWVLIALKEVKRSLTAGIV